MTMNNSAYDLYDQELYEYYYNELKAKNSSLLDILQQHTEEAPSSHVFAIILCIISTIANAIIGIIVVASPNLRTNILYLCIANFSFTNFVISVFVIPLSVYGQMVPWNLGENLCKVWLVSDVLLPYIAIVILFLMNVDRLCCLMCSQSYTCVMNHCLHGFVLILPWFVGVFTIIPLWMLGAMVYPYHEGFCYFGLYENAAVASVLLTYFLPALCIILTIIIVLVYNMRQRLVETHSIPSQTTDFTNTRQTSTSSLDEGKNVSLVTLCLADFFFVAMWFPYQLYQLLMCFCYHCYPPVSASVAFTWLGASTSAVLPLTWFSDVNIRDNIVRLLRNCCVKKATIEKDGDRNTVPLIDL